MWIVTVEDTETEITIVSGTEETVIATTGIDQGVGTANTIGKRVTGDIRLRVLSRQTTKTIDIVPRSNHSLIMTVKRNKKPSARKRKKKRPWRKSRDSWRRGSPLLKFVQISKWRTPKMNIIKSKARNKSRPPSSTKMTSKCPTFQSRHHLRLFHPNSCRLSQKNKKFKNRPLSL